MGCGVPGAISPPIQAFPTPTPRPTPPNPTPTPRPSLPPTGGPFNLMSRRVLGANAHLAEAAAAILAGCKYDPQEPPALPPLV